MADSIEGGYKAPKHTRRRCCGLLTSSQEVGVKFGEGVGSYMFILPRLAFGFLILGAFSMVMLIMANSGLYWASDRENQDLPLVSAEHGTGLSMFTLGTIPHVQRFNLTLEYIQPPHSHSRIPAPVFFNTISVIDLIATVVFIVYAMYVTTGERKFEKSVDENVTEVSDFSVVVHGLPKKASVREINRHFNRYGQVMDVVIVKDYTRVLKTCADAATLEANKELTGATLGTPQHEKLNAEAYKIIADTEKHIEEVDSLPMKFAFVTFFTEAERKNCENKCPSGWFGAWLMPSQDRFLKKHTYTVSKAYRPEDYIHKNLHAGSYQIFLNRSIVKVIVGILLILSFIACTHLNSMLQIYSTVLPFKMQLLNRDVTVTSGGQSTNHTTYCRSALSTCSAHLSAQYSTPVTLPFGSIIEWDDPAVKRRYETRLLKDLRNQTDVALTSAGCALHKMPCTSSVSSSITTPPMDSSCLPCYCLGLAEQPKNHVRTTESNTATTQACEQYVIGFDLKLISLQVTITVVVLAINITLAIVLQALSGFEMHSSKTDASISASMGIYVSQLLNVVIVNFLCNAGAVSRVSRRISHTIPNMKWIEILGGQYDDFSQGWYVDVGPQILLLMVLNIAVPFIDYAIEWVVHKIEMKFAKAEERARMSSHPTFALEERVPQVMVEVTLALLFGGGMPLFYFFAFTSIIVRGMLERIFLSSKWDPSIRYRRHLPVLILKILPFMLCAHCAVTLWMFTYFNPNGTVASVPMDDKDLTAWALNRITQSNGIPMLILFLPLFVGVLMFGPMLLVVLAEFPGHAYRRLTFAYTKLSKTKEETKGTQGSYFQAVMTPNDACALQGVPTYRIPHHPMYTSTFSKSLLAKIVYATIMGKSRPTHVVILIDGSIRVTQRPYFVTEYVGMFDALQSTEMSDVLRETAMKLLSKIDVEPEQLTVSEKASQAWAKVRRNVKQLAMMRTTSTFGSSETTDIRATRGELTVTQSRLSIISSWRELFAGLKKRMTRTRTRTRTRESTSQDSDT